MYYANLRFYEELNDFLSEDKRKKDLPYGFYNHPSVKDAIESFGIPHAEVDLIIANGISIDFNYQLQDGDRIAIYPVLESFDITPIVKLRTKPLRNLKFIADVHLGKLTKYLRMLGFDVLYRNNFEDKEIVDTAQAECRIILTRDIGLLKHKTVTHGYWIRETNPLLQVEEVLNRFDLWEQINPFGRCIHCNGLIKPVPKEKIIHLLPPRTKTYYQAFFQCIGCDQVYWEGSHFKNMLKFVNLHRIS
jgi:uncharacterized protein with PIN domain